MTLKLVLVFLLGLFLGTLFGIFIASLCSAAKRGESSSEVKVECKGVTWDGLDTK